MPRYEAALKLLHTGKHSKALQAFQELLPGVPTGLGHHIQIYIAVCERSASSHSESRFEDSNERFDYAILLLNSGRHRKARSHLEDMLRQEGKSPQILYGLALWAAAIGDTSECVSHLAEAIRLDEQYRLKAFYDSDFEELAGDPSFQELLIARRDSQAQVQCGTRPLHNVGKRNF